MVRMFCDGCRVRKDKRHDWLSLTVTTHHHPALGDQAEQLPPLSIYLDFCDWPCLEAYAKDQQYTYTRSGGDKEDRSAARGAGMDAGARAGGGGEGGAVGDEHGL